jgi:hypothetical protein
MQLIVSFAVILDLVFAQAQATACGKLGGTCVPRSNCNSALAHPFTNVCPNGQTCCVAIACNIPAVQDKVGGVFPGFCQQAGAHCAGRIGNNLCPNPKTSQCCSYTKTAAAVPDPVLSIGSTNLTPMGSRMLFQSELWKVLQFQQPAINSYPQPAMNGATIDKIMYMAGFNGNYIDSVPSRKMTRIVRFIPTDIKGNNYLYTQPNQMAGYYATEFNKIYGGYLPIGTMVVECNNADCSGLHYESHIGFVCKVTDAVESNGKLTKANFHLCHNNWLAGEVDSTQKLADTLGTVGQYLINQNLYKSGTIKAQWMSVPWIGIEWDQNGIVSKVEPLFPVTLTPEDKRVMFNPFKHHSFIAVPREISAGLNPSSRNFNKGQ